MQKLQTQPQIQPLLWAIQRTAEQPVDLVESLEKTAAVDKKRLGGSGYACFILQIQIQCVQIFAVLLPVVVDQRAQPLREKTLYGIMVNTVAPGAMFTPGCMVNGPVRTLPPEKQAELRKEMMVAKLDEIPTADSVAIVVYGMCTRMADGVTDECIVADSGMMRNIMAFQPAIDQYPPAEG